MGHTQTDREKLRPTEGLGLETYRQSCRIAKFEQSDGGTLFFDEYLDMPRARQAECFSFQVNHC